MGGTWKLGWLALVVAFAAVAGCGPTPQPEPASVEPGNDLPVEPPAPVSAEDMKALVEGNNRFAIDLYKKLAEKETRNIIFSPYSVSSALAMTYAGAKGETAEQIAKTFHFTLPPGQLHPAMGALARQLRSVEMNKGCEMQVANGLWLQRGRKFTSEFLTATKQHYHAEVREVDYSVDFEAVRVTINRWAAEMTKDRICELLKPGGVSPATQLILTNAICFDGEWEHPFPVSSTTNAKFEIAPGQAVMIPMMHHQEAPFRYYLGSDFHLVELPYRGGKATLLVLVPARRHGLPELEKTLTVNELQIGIDKLSSGIDELWLPRLELNSQVQMASVLASMGMPIAFSTAADYTGITVKCPPIRDIVHAAHISLNERGTAAAGASGVEMQTGLRPAPILFRVDHPFIFMVRDQHSGTIVFIGRVSMRP